MLTPFGTYVNASRFGGAEAAGSDARARASIHGNATSVPNPLRAVRREIELMSFAPFAPSLLERVGFHHRHDQGGELVPTLDRLGHDLVDRALVVVLGPATERVGQHLIREALAEL